MALLRMKLDGEKYEIDLNKITLGEARLLKRDYGLRDINELNFFDADQLTGIFVVAVKRTHPELSDDEAVKRVEGLETGPIFDDLNKQVEAAIKKAQVEQADPPQAAASASAPAARGGRSATTRATRGSRRTPKS